MLANYLISSAVAWVAVCFLHTAIESTPPRHSVSTAFLIACLPYTLLFYLLLEKLAPILREWATNAREAPTS